MDTTKDPLNNIQGWRDWYRKHRIVAEMDEPFVTKNSRENMHDTSNATNIFESNTAKEMWIEKAKEHFSDTLAEYQYELSGKDFYAAFYQAAKETMGHAQKEYERTKELVDLLSTYYVGEE